MTDLLQITKTEGHVTILHFDGSLDGQTESIAIESARTAKNAGARLLLIDLLNVDMVTSAGLRALIGIFKMYTPRNEINITKQETAEIMSKSPYFKLAGASSQIQYVLDIAGLLENIALYPTLQEALDSFSS